MLKKLTLLAISGVSAFAMHMAEININDKDVDGKLQFDMGQFNTNIEPDAIFLGARMMKGHRDHSDFSVDPKVLVEANFLMRRPFGAERAFTLGMGLKYDYTEFGDNRYSALPLGLEVGYRLPFDIPTPLHIGGALYYAPEVLSFGDAHDFLEYRVNIDIEIIDNGRITTGYRNIDTNIEHHNLNYNSAFYLGFKFAF
jgi:hypothetical protein